MSSAFASAACPTVQNFRVNNAWVPSQTIPYGMVMEVFNPGGTGCDMYITKIEPSAGSNVAYIQFGTAFATALMPGCTSNLQVTDLAFPFSPAVLPSGMVGVGLPCG